MLLEPVSPRLALRLLNFHGAPALGRPSQYDIHPGYRHRPEVAYYDDTENTDGWQREVYEAARELMLEHDLSTVADVGCGSAYKLVHILGEFETTGIDLPETIDFVRKKYPDRNWISGSFDDVDIPPADVVVCADVVEHVADPDALMRYLQRLTKGFLVLSTPDRHLVHGRRNLHRYGPPENPAHVREWSFDELAKYVSRFFKIERHFISNRPQATQCIVAVPGLAQCRYAKDYERGCPVKDRYGPDAKCWCQG